MADHTNLESRKLSIIEHLAELQDESILQQIENLLKPNHDFWGELSDAEKSSIAKGIENLEEGNRVAFSDFIAKYKKAK